MNFNQLVSAPCGHAEPVMLIKRWGDVRESMLMRAVKAFLQWELVDSLIEASGFMRTDNNMQH